MPSPEILRGENLAVPVEANGSDEPVAPFFACSEGIAARTKPSTGGTRSLRPFWKRSSSVATLGFTSAKKMRR